MIEFNCFPGGVHNCVTFSFDDGAPQDLRLSKLFGKYGLKCTFNLSDCMIRLFNDDFYNAYNGHEVACHGKNHRKINLLSTEGILDEMLTNRKTLENLCGYPVNGLAYAGGYHDDRSVEVLKQCGIVYGRTTRSTGNFDLPADFLRWHPTCHFKSATDAVERFNKRTEEKNDYPAILYIWGHSFEMREESEWTDFENILKAVSGNKNVWYATNIEIYNYITALKQVKVSVDESTVYNPTAYDIWVSVNGEPVVIPAGSTRKVM